jgi:hypothetical protein
MSQLKDIADAVRDALASVTYTSVVTQPVVVRLNWPEYDVESLAGPAIVVVPNAVAIQRVDRVHHEYVYSIVVWIARHTPTESAADGMYALAEEVADELRSHSWPGGVTFPAGVTSPTAIEMEINPDEALQDRNVWRAVVTSSYTVFRAVS